MELNPSKTAESSAPRVSSQRIDALVASLKFETAHVPNTNTTIATASLPHGFVVAVGESHCVSTALFDREKGKKYAIEDAVVKSRAKLWEMEGYVLSRQLEGLASSQVHASSGLPSKTAAEFNTDRAQLGALGAQPAVQDGQLFIGTKIVKAEPMTRLHYNTLRGWVVPPDEDPNDPGYLVEYTDGGKPNVPGRAGYVSWSPKEQFDKAYRPYDPSKPNARPTYAMPFGDAMEAMKRGQCVAREGWNGKGMFAYLVPANSYPAQTGAAKAHFGEGAMVPYNAYLALKGANGTVSTWAPSGSDALAEDWMVVDPAQTPA